MRQVRSISKAKALSILIGSKKSWESGRSNAIQGNIDWVVQIPEQTLSRSHLFRLVNTLLTKGNSNYSYFRDQNVDEGNQTKQALKDLIEEVLDFSFVEADDFIKMLKVISKANILNEANFTAIMDHNNPHEVARGIKCLKFLWGKKSHTMSFWISFGMAEKPLSVTQEIFNILLAAKKDWFFVASVFTFLHDFDKSYCSPKRMEIIAQHYNPELLHVAITTLNANGFFNLNNFEKLVDPANEFLFKDPSLKLWNEIAGDLITKDLFDQVLFLGTQENSQNKILEFLNPLVKYSKTRNTIKSAEIHHKETHFHKWEIYGKLIGMPRYLVAEFLKEVFSWGLGFSWLLKLIGRLDLPYFQISLPTLAISRPESNDRFLRMIGYDSNPAWAGHITPGSTSYPINPLNFLFVPINYIARNIGKTIGVVLLLPWTIPVTLVNRAVHTIQSAWHARVSRQNLKVAVEDGNKSQVVFDFLSGAITLEKPSYLLKILNGNDISTGVEKYMHYALERAFQKNSGAEWKSKALPEIEKLEKVIDRRSKITKVGGIFATVIFGILLSPLSLLLSIPLLVRAIRKNQEIKNGVTEGKSHIESLEAGINYLLSGCRDNYQVGMECLEQSNQHGAYIFLSRVSDSHPNYSSAMFECGNIALSQGDHETANDFFSKANDSPMKALSEKLKAGEDVRVDKAFVPLESPKTEAVEQPGYKAQSPRMFKLPVESRENAPENTAESEMTLGNNA